MSRPWKWRIGVYSVLAAMLVAGSVIAFKWADHHEGPHVIFAGTPQVTVDRMLETAAVTKDDVVYDLGCGDARFLITAAKRYGCRAVGVEIDPKVVARARKNVADNGLEGLVEIREGDLFNVDLRPATVITIYLLPEINVKLIPQFKQLRPGSRIVSYLFAMQGVKPKETVKFQHPTLGDQTYYLWVTPLEFEDS